MEIGLGVSMTPTTIRMVLVEGERADGVIVDQDVIDLTAVDGAVPSSASERVIAAVLGTQESAIAAGHRLVSTGVTWSDRTEAALLRDAVTARGIDDVMLVSQLHAAGALAQAAGRLVGDDRTALLFVERDTATLSVVDSADGSIVQVLSRSLHSADAMAVLAEMVTSLDVHDARSQGMFVVGSGVDVTAVTSHLQSVAGMPVSAPDWPELALARGAALAAAHAPRFDASTVGLAYSKEPEDATTAGAAYSVSPAGDAGASLDGADIASCDDGRDGREPFLLVGSSLAGIFGVGVMALVIALVVNISSTADQRLGSGQVAVHPSTAAPAPPAGQNAQPANPSRYPSPSRRPRRRLVRRRQRCPRFHPRRRRRCRRLRPRRRCCHRGPHRSVRRQRLRRRSSSCRCRGFRRLRFFGRKHRNGRKRGTGIAYGDVETTSKPLMVAAVRKPGAADDAGEPDANAQTTAGFTRAAKCTGIKVNVYLAVSDGVVPQPDRSGWFVGCGVNRVHGFCGGGVARNKTAAVRTTPAAIGADVVVGEGGDDVPDRERPRPHRVRGRIICRHNLVTRCPDLRSSHRPGRAARPSTNISDKTSIRFCTNWPAQQQILQTRISPKPAG